MIRFLSVMVLAVAMQANAADVPDAQAEAAHILAQKTGLSDADLQPYLADCDANRQTMYFCGWRNQIVAEQVFRRALAVKAGGVAECKTSYEAKAASWEKEILRDCTRIAHKDFAGGSMESTAQVNCLEDATKREMMRRLAKLRACSGG